MSLNVYHLEVFFHVAKHGSVSQAAESMRKEQPTISALIGDLEKSLGDVRLFHRRPFKLTDQGKELFEAIRSFFTDLPKIEEKIRGGDIIRIGASPIILRDHLPPIEKQLRQKFPRLRLFLREGNEPQLLRDVERDDIEWRSP